MKGDGLRCAIILAFGAIAFVAFRSFFDLHGYEKSVWTWHIPYLICAFLTVRLINIYTCSKLSAHLAVILLFLSVMCGFDYFSDNLIDERYWIYGAIGAEIIAFIRHWFDGTGSRGTNRRHDASLATVGHIR